MFNLRGKIVPVVNFAKILEIPSPSNERPNIIVLENKTGSKDFGVEVDEVLEVVKIGENQTEQKIESDKKLNYFTMSAVTDLQGHEDKIIYLLKDEISQGISEAS